MRDRNRGRRIDQSREKPRGNDQGQACLAGLPDGEAQVEFLPEENTDRELGETRQEIHGVLERIVADQKEQAAQHEAELAQQSGIQRSFTHVHSFERGLSKLPGRRAHLYNYFVVRAAVEKNTIFSLLCSQVFKWNCLSPL